MVHRRWARLVGLTDADDERLVQWARSYARPPSLTAKGAQVAFQGWSAERRSVALTVDGPTIEIAVRPETPWVNPVFELAVAPEGVPTVSLDGVPLALETFAWDGRTLWIDATLAAPATIRAERPRRADEARAAAAEDGWPHSGGCTVAWLSAVRGLVLATTPLIGVLTTGPEAAAQPASGPPIGEAEIRAFDDAYVRLFDGGDAKGLASLFTEDAEVFEADGARYRGRDLIERSFAESMAAQKGARLSLEIESIRLLTPDVAKEEGRSVTTLASGAVDSRYYTALIVKREGGWLLASVREE
ncbi:hypothetical protein HK102_013141, partial [Quaeritorhiza haematococci]